MVGKENANIAIELRSLRGRTTAPPERNTWQGKISRHIHPRGRSSSRKGGGKKCCWRSGSRDPRRKQRNLLHEHRRLGKGVLSSQKLSPETIYSSCRPILWLNFFLSFFFFCICSACHRRRFTELYFRDSRHPTPLVNHWPCQGHVRRGWAKPASCLFECFFERNANKGLQIPPIIEGTTSQSVVVNACEKIVSHNQSQVSQWNFVVWNYLEQRLTYIIYTDMGIVFILQPVVRENNTGNDGKKQRNKVSSKGNKVIEFWFTKSRETCVTVFDA